VAATLDARFPEVVAAYLFGSQRAGRARRDSDVDVALLLEAELDPGEELTLRLDALAALQPLTGGPRLDLVAIGRSAPPVLAFEALRGDRIHCRDLGRCLELEARLRSRYYDTHHLRTVQQAYLRQWFTQQAQSIDHGR